MLSYVDVIAGELLLFAACGVLLFAIDDLLVDLIWIWGTLRLGTRKRPGKRSVTGPLSVFIPAWKEEAVLPAMIERCIKVWVNQDVIIFVGTYPNDAASRASLSPLISDSIRLVVLDHDGPTTKADCLNGLWAAMTAVEQESGILFDGVVLHDAEDRVHPHELHLFREYLGEFDLIQIPVVPVVDQHSRWISGHYLDEFAEAHRKELVVRQWIGASLPSAGTGCAISRRALGKLAAQRSDLPFDAESLTEDYELGLRLSEMGFKSAFVRGHSPDIGDLIAVHSSFPATLTTAVRQKTRWVIGIALAGWDRTGWRGGLVEHWMRWRDRRSILATLLIFAAYLGLVASLPGLAGGNLPSTSAILPAILAINALFVFWRLTLRVGFTTAQYGFAEGWRAAPRTLVSNLVSVMASGRAVVGYCRMLKSGVVIWDKTEHRIPDDKSNA